MIILDFGAAALVFGIFGLVLARLARNIPGWPRRLCVAILAAAMASAVVEMLVRAAAQYQVPVPGYRALMVLRSVASPLPTLLVFAYILYCCGEDYRKNLFLRVLCILSGLLAAGSILLEMIGEIGPAPDYELRWGLWPALLFFISVALSTAEFIALLRRWKKLTNAQRIMFFSHIFEFTFRRYHFCGVPACVRPDPPLSGAAGRERTAEDAPGCGADAAPFHL